MIDFQLHLWCGRLLNLCWVLHLWLLHFWVIHISTPSADPQNSGSKLMELKRKNTCNCYNVKIHVNYNVKIRVNCNVKIHVNYNVQNTSTIT